MFGKRLKELRKEYKLTQTEMALILNLTRSTIALLEGGYNRPSVQTLIDIADFFNVSTDYMLGRTNINKENPYEGLPDEAVEKVKKFIAFSKNKYKK
jgi:transcriptional regulator with XRE-family HTH domain